MNPRDRRALLWGGAVVCAAVMLRVIPAAWDGLSSRRSALQARAELLERSRWELRQAAALEDSAVIIKAKVLTLAPRILAGVNEAEAAADLTARLKRVAVESRVRVERTTSLGDSSAAEGLRRVSLRAALEGDSRGVVGMLGSLARGKVVVVPTDLRITAANPAAPGAVAEVLKMELTVGGWYLPRPEPAR